MGSPAVACFSWLGTRERRGRSVIDIGGAEKDDLNFLDDLFLAQRITLPCQIAGFLTQVANSPFQMSHSAPVFLHKRGVEYLVQGPRTDRGLSDPAGMPHMRKASHHRLSPPRTA